MSRGYRLDAQSDIVGEVYETENVDVCMKIRETSNPKVYTYSSNQLCSIFVGHSSGNLSLDTPWTTLCLPTSCHNLAAVFASVHIENVQVQASLPHARSYVVLS